MGAIPQSDSAARRNLAFRLAFAVAVGLVVEILRGAVMPPLAAVIAVQLLALPGPRPPGKVVVGLLAVITGASLFAYAVSVLTSGNAFLFAIGIGLVYLWGFALAMQPKTAAPGAMILTMGIVVTTLSAVSTGLAILLVVELIVSVIVGIGLVYLAHAAFPARARPAQARPAPVPVAPVPLATRALVATLIILPLHLYLTADGLAALVVLLTVATMLRQPGIAHSVRYGASFAAGNLLGGLLAAFTVFLVALQPNIVVLASVATAAALLAAWQIVETPARASVLLPGFVAFALLFGLAFSPLTPTANVDVIARVAQIVLAAIYALGALSLVEPLLTRHAARPRDRSSPDPVRAV